MVRVLLEGIKNWLLLSLFGGILMIISTTAGNLVFYILFYDFISEYILDEFINTTLLITLVVVQVIAESGGIAVIIGTMLISVDHYKYGKFLSSLGTGIGVIGFIFLFLITLYLGLFLVEGAFSITILICGYELIGFIGFILAVISRRKITRLKKKEEVNV